MILRKSCEKLRMHFTHLSEATWTARTCSHLHPSRPTANDLRQCRKSCVGVTATEASWDSFREKGSEPVCGLPKENQLLPSEPNDGPSCTQLTNLTRDSTCRGQCSRQCPSSGDSWFCKNEERFSLRNPTKTKMEGIVDSHFADENRKNHRLVVQTQRFWQTTVNFGRLLHLGQNTSDDYIWYLAFVE